MNDYVFGLLGLIAIFETLLAMYWHKKCNKLEELLKQSGYVWDETE